MTPTAGVTVMDGTVAPALATGQLESNATEGLGTSVTNGHESAETPRLTLLEQYRKLEV